MTPLRIRFLSLAAFALFCATATYWALTLATHRAAPVEAAAPRTPVSTDQAALLFGGQLVPKLAQDVHLSGILALREGAAAIVSIGDAPPRVVSPGDSISPDVTLAEVHARSIVIDRHGAHTEISMPASTTSAASGTTIYMR